MTHIGRAADDQQLDTGGSLTVRLRGHSARWARTSSATWSATDNLSTPISASRGCMGSSACSRATPDV